MSDKPSTRIVMYVVIDENNKVIASYSEADVARDRARADLTTNTENGWMVSLANKKRRVVRCEGTY